MYRVEWVGVDELNRVAFVRRRVPGGWRVRVYRHGRLSLARLRGIAITDTYVRTPVGWGFAFTNWRGRRRV